MFVVLLLVLRSDDTYCSIELFQTVSYGIWSALSLKLTGKFWQNS